VRGDRDLDAVQSRARHDAQAAALAEPNESQRVAGREPGHASVSEEPAPARERYDSVFGDQIVKVGNAWRMAKGDNRQLPVGETRYTGRLSLGQSLRRLVARAFRR